KLLRVISVVFTFYLVVVGWVLFRAETFARAWAILRDMHWPRVSSVWTYRTLVILLLVLLGLASGHLVSYLKDATLRSKAGHRPIVFWPFVVAVLSLAIGLGVRGEAFIYFQF